jgi:hypothetical protein
VESESGEQPYLVDLLQYRRHGQCDCRNFRVEIQPIWEAGAIPPVKSCKHIRRCRRHLAHRIMSCSGVQSLSHRQQESIVNVALVVWWEWELAHKEEPLRFGCGERMRFKFKRIAPKSEKRIQEDERYFELAIQFKLDHPFCEVCALRGLVPRPTRDIHHRRGRAGNLRLAVETWTAICRECHDHLENNKAWAKQLGLIEKWGVQI